MVLVAVVFLRNESAACLSSSIVPNPRMATRANQSGAAQTKEQNKRSFLKDLDVSRRNLAAAKSALFPRGLEGICTRLIAPTASRGSGTLMDVVECRGYL